MMNRSVHPRAFKAKLRAFATTLLNGPYKSKESKKETTCQELRAIQRNTLCNDKGRAPPPNS
jgi:hypothetical protein